MYTKEALELELTEYFKSVLCTSRICVANNVASNLDIRLTKRNKVYVSYYCTSTDIRRIEKKVLLGLVDRAAVELEEAMLQEIKDKLDLNVSNENFLVAVHTHHKSIYIQWI